MHHPLERIRHDECCGLHGEWSKVRSWRVDLLMHPIPNHFLKMEQHLTGGIVYRCYVYVERCSVLDKGLETTVFVFQPHPSSLVSSSLFACVVHNCCCHGAHLQKYRHRLYLTGVLVVPTMLKFSRSCPTSLSICCCRQEATATTAATDRFFFVRRT